jgi:hypothetical protein
MMHVNGIPFSAFANLAHAIEETHCYRLTEYGEVKTLLWADQIYINSSDKAERSHQFGLMYDIYRSARDIALCLSTEQQRAASAIQWIQDFDKRYREVMDSWFELWHQFHHDILRRGWLDTIQMLQQPCGQEHGRVPQSRESGWFEPWADDAGVPGV